MQYRNQSFSKRILNSVIFWAVAFVVLVGAIVAAFMTGLVEFTGNVYVGRTLVQTVEVEKQVLRVVNEPVTVEVDRFIGVPQTVEVDRIVEVPVTVEVETRVEVPATVIVELHVPVTVIVERAVPVPVDVRQESGSEDPESPVATPDDTGRIVRPPHCPCIETSDYHTCELRVDGTLVCWGGTSGLLNESNEKYTSVTVGRLHSCGLRPDGSPVCWGRDDQGRAQPPVHDRFVAISAGSVHTCALRVDGTPVCWGSQSNLRQSTPPENEKFVAIESGSISTCGLRVDGSIACWGQYGTAPKTLRTATTSRLLLGSSDQTKCALRNDGDAVCWQDGAAQKPFVGPFTQITVGSDFSVRVARGWQTSVPLDGLQ